MARELKQKKNIAKLRIKKSPEAQFDKHERERIFETKGIPTEAKNVRTTAELVAYLEANPDCVLDAQVLSYEKNNGQIYKTPINKAKFINTFKENNKVTSSKTKFKEAFDAFARDSSFPSSNLVGNDFIPLLGGPFYKQLYYYNDYLQAHGESFFAFHHDPIARAIINVTRNFVLGRGFRVDCDDKFGLAVWQAFEEVNKLQETISQFVTEISLYGEDMIWWLPQNETKISYKDDTGGQTPPPKGLIPRIRLVDPSNIVEIVTYPEDITRVLYYVWMTPTQYQTYTQKDGKGTVVPSTKFIYRQIPADQMVHEKINCVSNEKRGRSDLYPVMGYLKRLRDSVNYAIISEQKNAAWSIDTTIEGDETDIDNYIAAQHELGTIPAAGSEFVHTAAVKRTYLGNTGSPKSSSNSFDWTLSMISAGSGIPTSYFGTHLSGGQTRASALVVTEPVAKKFEERQQLVERVVKGLAKRLFEYFGIDAEVEITFPEIAVQDRSAKLKDLRAAELAGWISNRRAGEIAAKELGITEYNYEEEKAEVDAHRDEQMANMGMDNPLSAAPKQPGMPGQPQPGKPVPNGADKTNAFPKSEQKPSKITSQDRREIAKNDKQ